MILPVGTMVGVLRIKRSSQICVVECGDPLILRPATAIERLRFWWESRRLKADEIAATSEAMDAIERAKEKAQ